MTTVSGTDVNPGDVTTVSGTDENPGDVTTVSGTDVNPGDVTTVSGTDVNPGDVTTVSGTDVNPGDSTTDPGTGTADPTTTTTLPNGVKIVTSYKVSFTAPTRVNYWSHDTRSFKESGGLKDLAASLTIFKFYVNESNQVCDVNGNPMTAPNGMAYTFGENGNATDAQAFETKNLDITDQTHPLYSEDSPIKVWTNEIKAQFGDNYTAEQELSATHKNKYPMKAYYHPTEQSDPDGLIGTEPIYLGDFNIYIGVKGDYNLDNVVSIDDVQNALIFYTEYYVAKKKTTKLNEDPELDGEDGLIFYLINVRYRDGDTKDAPLSNPQVVSVDDVTCMLKYYTEKYVALKPQTDWEWAVGYDLLDKFYGDNYE